MTLEEMKKQIRTAVDKYNDQNPKAAMLSGMSLVASFLAKCDGSKTITPAFVLSAIYEVATEQDLAIGKLRK